MDQEDIGSSSFLIFESKRLEQKLKFQDYEHERSKIDET